MKKNSIRRMTALVLCGAMLCGLPAFAVDRVQNTAAVAEENRLPSRMMYYGRIIDRMEDETGKLTAICADSTHLGTIVFKVDGDTMILDSGKALPLDTDALTVGEGVYVFYGPAMTHSLPPQAKAEAIVMHPRMDERAAMLYTAEQLEKNADGSVTVTTDNGLRLKLVENDLVYQDAAGRPVLKMDDVQLGTRFFAWYGALSDDLPATAEPYRIAVLPAAYSDVPVLVNGKSIEGAARTVNGQLVIPAAAAARALGYEVSYECRGVGDEAVTMRKGNTTLEMHIGTETYVVDGDRVMPYKGASFIEAPGVTWMPAEVLAQFSGAAVSFTDGQLIFETGK